MFCEKTKLCKFQLRGACTRGGQCTYAHSGSEKLPEPDLRRTKLCPNLVRAGGCDQSECSFAHSQDELRMASVPAQAQDCATAASCSQRRDSPVSNSSVMSHQTTAGSYTSTEFSRQSTAGSYESMDFSDIAGNFRDFQAGQRTSSSFFSINCLCLGRVW